MPSPTKFVGDGSCKQPEANFTGAIISLTAGVSCAIIKS